MSGSKKAKTYKEALIAEEVAARGIDLVPRIANILLRRGAIFRGKTTDSEWSAAEEKLGFKLPPDYKRLCNTVGTSATWCSGMIRLHGPDKIYERMIENKKNYAEWQLEQSPQSVAVYPNQPGFHLQWSSDVEGNALAFFWIVNSEDPSRWPTVQLEMEAPLRHNGNIYPATVSECLFRELTDTHGSCPELGEYEEEDEDDEDEDEDEVGKKIIIKERNVFSFFAKGEEPDKKRQKGLDETKTDNTEETPGSVADEADFSPLEDPKLEPIEEKDCKDVAVICTE